MSFRTIVRVVPLAVAIAMLTGGAAHAEIALGASFGYTHLSYPDVPGFSSEVIGFPGAEERKQPGLRVGYLAPGGRWDINADVGLVHSSSSNSFRKTTIELMPQVQANAPGRNGYSLFVNGGVGLLYERIPYSATRLATGTRPVLGAGVGVRKSVSDGHGLLRVELRYDHIPKDEHVVDATTTIIFLATNMVSVKVGFDLLVAR